MPALDAIVNYVEISPRLGTAGQPSPDQFAALRQAGYELVINLLPEVSPSYLPEEAGLAAALGMAYVAIPVVWEQPTRADLEQFFAAMRANQGRKVFVHCAKNMRVSAFVYLYRVLVEGVAPEVARVALRRVWEPNPVWQAFIDAQCRQA